MVSQTGEFEVTLDIKGRFLLPAAIKKILPEGEPYIFKVNRGYENCLNLFTLKNWEPVYKKLNRLNHDDPNDRRFKRIFLDASVTIEPDTAGRLMLPRNLMQFAHLDKNIVLILSTDRIEIWDKARHDELINSITPEDYSALGSKVMGQKEENLTVIK